MFERPFVSVPRLCCLLLSLSVSSASAQEATPPGTAEPVLLGAPLEAPPSNVAEAPSVSSNSVPSTDPTEPTNTPAALTIPLTRAAAPEPNNVDFGADNEG